MGCGGQFHILYSVMKLRLEYNILKHFQSILCIMFEYRHISPPKVLRFGEKSAFLTQKNDGTLLHDFSPSQPSWSAKNEQNITLQQWQNSGETDLVTRIHQNMTKIGWFWAFSHFVCSWGHFFANLCELALRAAWPRSIRGIAAFCRDMLVNQTIF